MTSATLQTRPPELGSRCDLEALFGQDIGPDYVLTFIPPLLCARLRDRITADGWWELATLDDYEAGNPPREDWILDAPRETPAEKLTAWVAERVGHLVALERDTTRCRTTGPFARWLQITLYWVRRDT